MRRPGIAGLIRALLTLAVTGALVGFAWTTLSAAEQNVLPGIVVEPGAQMLVESDQLVYDYDNDTVSAVGNVKIYYDRYTLEAERVTYNQVSGRLIANGRVKLTDPSGIQYFAEDFDITDDFRAGFVESLRVETPDQTYFAAERAERIDGERTEFVHGVYTACEPCKDKPQKPPLWQVKAAKIIVNQKTQMIEFQNASFEFLGVPIAWLPYFTVADPSVRRKTGFLAPSIGYAESLGWSVTAPYFIALAPNSDLTLTPTYLSRQGFLGEAEWRHRLSHGQYSVRVAGIRQNDPGAFLTSSGGGTYAQREFRGGIRTTGDFDLNKWWSLGWDGTLTTDRTFTRNYSVLNNDKVFTTSQIHLTGLRDRNFFDARAEYFQVLADKNPGNPANAAYNQGRQAVITPIVDRNQVFSHHSVFGGELSMTSNLTVLSRDENDPFMVGSDPTVYYHGLAGTFVRATHQVQWQRKIIGPGGQVITPFASLRGDIFSLNPDSVVPASLTTESTPTRFMPAVGVEWSWPIMAVAGASSHVFEPMAQLIVRPNEPLAGQLPNDDAQSLLYDDTILFERDKFSGFDRVEGGIRLNAGLRYVGNFANGMTIEGLIGQSFNLAGQNSFAVNDIADTGAFSGLETSRSDYIARLSVDTGTGTRLSIRGRFDDKDLTINASQVEATKAVGPLTASATYIYAREIPEAGVATATSQATASASVNFIENWRVFGSAVYDLTSDLVTKDSVGIAFDNSCVSLSLAYSRTRGTDIPTKKVMLRLLLRTLAEGTATANISNLGAN